MLGAIVGDICGSIYEADPVPNDDFHLLGHYGYNFTDETVLTVAIADAYINNKPYAQTLSDYVKNYPLKPYGRWFRHWATSRDLEPYNSFGNGSAMRVSPIGFLAKDETECFLEAQKSAEVTHNHPEGIKGAQAVAYAIYLARIGEKKYSIREKLEEEFGYNLHQSLLEIRKTYRFDVTCQGSVPQAIIAFLESTDFESAIKNAILLRGDADTQASIAGAIAEAYYKTIPQYCVIAAYRYIDDAMKEVVQAFYERYEVQDYIKS